MRSANAEKTHCSNGHPLTEPNIKWYTSKNGYRHRRCLVCSKMWADKSNAAKPRKTARRRSWTIEDRFWSYVDAGGPIPEHRPGLGPCWMWLAGTTNGYGVLARGGRGTGQVKVHRFAYELLIGPIPDDVEPDHLCRVPGCCNPWHLELVTHRENCLRGTSPVAVAFRRDQCGNGHVYTDETLRWVGNKRRCRVCDAASMRKYRSTRR